MNRAIPRRRWPVAALSLALLVACVACDGQARRAASPIEVKARVHAILADKAYRSDADRESAVGALLRRGREVVGRWLDDLRKRFKRTAEPSVSPRTAQWLFWVVVVSLAAALLALLAVVARAAWLAYRGRPERASKPRVTAIPSPDDPTEAEPNAWLTLARQCLETGDLRGAYRAAFLALLVGLNGRGAIRWHRSRTNGDYLRDLRSAPDIHRAVRPLALQFDAVWYGHADVGAGDVDRCIALAAEYSAAPTGAAGA
jgi:hypothetical protein